LTLLTESGIAPLVVNSGSLVNWLNADYVDGLSASAFQRPLNAGCRSGQALTRFTASGKPVCVALGSGPRGPQGPPGPQGEPGVDGKDGQSPVEIATWTESAPAQERGSLIVGSEQGIGEGDLVQASKASLTGDFSTCPRGSVAIGMPDRAIPGVNSGFLAVWNIRDGAVVTADADAVVSAQWTQGPPRSAWPGFRITATCIDESSGDPRPIATPAFDVSVTFTWTKAPPKVTFN
jgi:hypothetical protein